jgi:hypothetical protein
MDHNLCTTHTECNVSQWQVQQCWNACARAYRSGWDTCSHDIAHVTPRMPMYSNMWVRMVRVSHGYTTMFYGQYRCQKNRTWKTVLSLFKSQVLVPLIYVFFQPSVVSLKPSVLALNPVRLGLNPVLLAHSRSSMYCKGLLNFRLWSMPFAPVVRLWNVYVQDPISI